MRKKTLFLKKDCEKCAEFYNFETQFIAKAY